MARLNPASYLREERQSDCGAVMQPGLVPDICGAAAVYLPRHPKEADSQQHDQPLLAEVYSASISGRVAIGPRAGRRVAKVGDSFDVEDLAVPPVPRCAAVAGFSVHADVCVPAHGRARLERLCRYTGRPPVATERLSVLPDGRLLYRLKRRWRDGTTANTTSSEPMPKSPHDFGPACL